MAKNSFSPSRRTVLKTIGVSGLTATAGQVTAQNSESESDENVNILEIGVYHEITTDDSRELLETANDTFLSHMITSSQLLIPDDLKSSHPIHSENFVAISRAGGSKRYNPVQNPVVPHRPSKFLPVEIVDELRPIVTVPVKSPVNYSATEIQKHSSGDVTLRHNGEEKEVPEGETAEMNIGTFDVEARVKSDTEHTTDSDPAKKSSSESGSSDESYASAETSLSIVANNRGNLDIIEVSRK